MSRERNQIPGEIPSEDPSENPVATAVDHTLASLMAGASSMASARAAAVIRNTRERATERMIAEVKARGAPIVTELSLDTIRLSISTPNPEKPDTGDSMPMAIMEPLLVNLRKIKLASGIDALTWLENSCKSKWTEKVWISHEVDLNYTPVTVAVPILKGDYAAPAGENPSEANPVKAKYFPLVQAMPADPSVEHLFFTVAVGGSEILEDAQFIFGPHTLKLVAQKSDGSGTSNFEAVNLPESYAEARAASDTSFALNGVLVIHATVRHEPTPRYSIPVFTCSAKGMGAARSKGPAGPVSQGRELGSAGTSLLSMTGAGSTESRHLSTSTRGGSHTVVAIEAILILPVPEAARHEQQSLHDDAEDWKQLGQEKADGLIAKGFGAVDQLSAMLYSHEVVASVASAAARPAAAGAGSELHASSGPALFPPATASSAGAGTSSTSNARGSGPSTTVFRR